MRREVFIPQRMPTVLCPVKRTRKRDGISHGHWKSFERLLIRPLVKCWRHILGLPNGGLLAKYSPRPYRCEGLVQKYQIDTDGFFQLLTRAKSQLYNAPTSELRH